MKQSIIITLLTLLTITGCTTIGAMRPWTVQETKDWYEEYYVNQPKQPRPFVSPLYYRGTDDKFHFFICRSMDEWVFIKIKADSVTIPDQRTKWKRKYSTGSMGYYPVDPLNNFTNTDKITKHETN